jgi:microcystin-dependent protein
VLPDLRGRVIAGKDDAGGSAASRLTSAKSGVDGTKIGAAGGAEEHVLTTAQLPAHNHTASTDTTAAHTHTYAGHDITTTTGPADNSGNGSVTMIKTVTESTPTLTSNTGGSHSHAVTVNNTGSGNAHPNAQPTFVGNPIIKL